MLRYILYARKSSEDKSKQVTSIQSQLDEMELVARRKGLNIIATIIESRSAKEPGRPEYNKVISMIQRGEADGIVCWHLNRLTRNEMDSGTLRWFLRSGVIKEIVTPDRIFLPEDNAFLTAIETAAGEQFIQDLKKGSHRGTMTKVRAGGVPYKAPVGYSNNRLTKSIEVDPIAFPIIREAWQKLLSGVPIRVIKNESPIQIATSRWYLLFASQFYTGKFSYLGEPYQGSYPPMITESEYEQAQERLGTKIEKHQSKHSFSYSGIIRCGRCGHFLTADRKKKVTLKGVEKFYTYYACSDGVKGKCVRETIREDKIEEAIRRKIGEISIDQDFWELAKSVNLRYAKENSETSSKVYELQVLQLQKLNDERVQLLRMRTQDKIDDETFDSENARIAAAITALRRNISLTYKEVDKSWESVNNLFEFSASAEKAFEFGDVEARGWIAKRLAAKYVFSNGRLDVSLNELLEEVRTYLQDPNFKNETFELKNIGSYNTEVADTSTSVPSWGGQRESDP